MTSLLLALSLASTTPASHRPSPWESEVVYQIFPRSFRDSNGDRVGDFNGIASKLDFLKSLGVTALLINPIVKSRCYHNYFADDFFKTDPRFGTNSQFFHLVREAHRRHIKVILDMETQYVAEGHPWYAATTDTASPYRSYLWNVGTLFGAKLPLYDGTSVRVTSVNPDNPAVLAYNKRIYRYWTAPNGVKNDGVDGFRIDHMMDDLDWKHVKTGMLTRFWLPVIASVRAIKPNAFFIGEQSDWKQWGGEYYRKAKVDSMYAIPLHDAFLKFNRDAIVKAIHDYQASVPTAKTSFIFVEDHDVERFASVVNSNSRLLRLGAVFEFTMKGTPLIYYGQELGMKGIQGKGMTDGNDIPIRLGYRWTSRVTDPGTAIWYKNSGPWWSQRFSSDHDGISVQEEAPRPDSLLNFYKKLIHLRKSNRALRSGSLKVVDVGNDRVVAYEREYGHSHVLVTMNLSGKTQSVSYRGNLGTDLFQGTAATSNRFWIPAYGFRILSTRR